MTAPGSGTVPAAGVRHSASANQRSQVSVRAADTWDSGRSSVAVRPRAPGSEHGRWHLGSSLFFSGSSLPCLRNGGSFPLAVRGSRPHAEITMSLRAAALLSPSLIIGLLSFNGAGDRGLWPPSRVLDGVATTRGPAVLRGRVLLPDDGSPLGLRAHLVTQGYRDSVDVDAAGGFMFAVPPVACDSLDLLLDPTDEAVRRYHSARLRVAVPAAADSASETVRALLVPTTF